MIFLKAILYLHVGEGITNPENDLQIQERDLRNHCLIHHIEIIGVYRDISADNTLNRSEFAYLLSFIEENEGTATMILIASWEKIVRNVHEAKTVFPKMNGLCVYAEAIHK